MSEATSKLLEQALALTPDERFQLAQQLFDSLDAEGLLPDDPAFYDELARRSDEAHAHTERLIPWEQAHA